MPDKKGLESEWAEVNKIWGTVTATKHMVISPEIQINFNCKKYWFTT